MSLVTECSSVLGLELERERELELEDKLFRVILEIGSWQLGSWQDGMAVQPSCRLGHKQRTKQNTSFVPPRSLATRTRPRRHLPSTAAPNQIAH